MDTRNLTAEARRRGEGAEEEAVDSLRAISLWQPFGSGIALGLKKNETRHWATNYRGLLLIHAAQTKRAWEHIYSPVVSEAFEAQGITEKEHLYFGAFVALVRLKDCVRVETIRDSISPLEFAMGDYSNGRFAWPMELVVRFDEPIPAKGHQGFWNVPASILPASASSALSAPRRLGGENGKAEA